MSGPIPLSGQDATEPGIQNVLLGNQTMSVYKPIQDEAARGGRHRPGASSG